MNKNEFIASLNKRQIDYSDDFISEPKKVYNFLKWNNYDGPYIFFDDKNVIITRIRNNKIHKMSISFRHFISICDM